MTFCPYPDVVLIDSLNFWAGTLPTAHPGGPRDNNDKAPGGRDVAAALQQTAGTVTGPPGEDRKGL